MKTISAISHSLKLFIPAYFLGIVGVGVSFWTSVLLGAFASISSLNPVPLLGFSAVGLIFVVIGLLWYLLWGFLYWLLLKCLWIKPPEWLRLSHSRSESLQNYGIAIVSTLPLAIIFFMQVAFHSGMQTLNEFYVSPKGYALKTMMQLWWLWLLTSFCAYYCKASLKSPKLKPKKA